MAVIRLKDPTLVVEIEVSGDLLAQILTAAAAQAISPDTPPVHRPPLGDDGPTTVIALDTPPVHRPSGSGN